MNAKRYERTAIVVTAENAESKKKYDRAEKLAEVTMKRMQRICCKQYDKWSDDESRTYQTLGNRYALLMAISYTAHADIVKGASCKTESRRRAHRHLNAYRMGLIAARHYDEMKASKWSEFWNHHIDEVPADWRNRMLERIEEERNRGN